MADRIPGINFTGPVVPNLDNDTYPSHYAKYGKGGWKEVSTIQDRDAIPEPRLEVGMMVYVTSEAKGYILTSLNTFRSCSLSTRISSSIVESISVTTFTPCSCLMVHCLSL